MRNLTNSKFHLISEDYNGTAHDIYLDGKELLISDCKVVDVTEIVRSKRINGICYDKVPVILRNGQLRFTTDGIGMVNESAIVGCEPEIEAEETVYIITSLSCIVAFILIVLNCEIYRYTNKLNMST
uniref:Glycoprotein n=1 Tax=Rhabditophanes sp. KR3021 TaxID=114890 RepID=A0AC35TTJ5_9BILA